MSTRSEFDGLWSVYLPIALGVAVAIWLILVFVVVRRRAGRAEPGGRAEMPALELGAAAFLAVVAAGLLVLTFRAESRVDASPSEPVEVRVTAYQWGWRFEYPGRGASSAGSNHPTLAVPVGEPVHFELASRDVIHAFWIPSERFKRDAIPGRTSAFNLTFDSPGMNGGVCAEYCGLGHTGMDFNLLALEPAAYQRWLTDHRGGGS